MFRGINLRKIAEQMGGSSGAEVKGTCTEAGEQTKIMNKHNKQTNKQTNKQSSKQTNSDTVRESLTSLFSVKTMNTLFLMN